MRIASYLSVLIGVLGLMVLLVSLALNLDPMYGALITMSGLVSALFFMVAETLLDDLRWR